MFAIDEHVKNNPALLNVRDLLSGYPVLNVDHKDYNINVTANYGQLLEKDALISEISHFNGSGKPAHLYFHIPICSYICHFCNYVKRLPSKNKPLSETMDQWVDLLIDEASRHQLNAPWIRAAMIESVYLGGGTAALMNSDQLARLMRYVRENYNLSKNCEISLEGNPDNFVSDLSSRAIEQGFNRFSVGIQSLQDEVLRFTGRGHDALMSRTAIETLLKTNKPFNADFMFGLPYQTPDTVEHDINALIEMGVPTITIYRLRNSDRASMGIGNRSAWNNEKVRIKLESQNIFPSLELTYDMRQRIVSAFLKNGYYPSPCGWWSKKGAYDNDGNIPHVSRNKWERFNTMLAYGPGAYGWLTGDSNVVYQTHNIQDINSYINFMQSSKKLPIGFGRRLEAFQSLSTQLGFAFKANQPIYLEKYQNIYGIDLMNHHQIGEVIFELINNKFIEFNQYKKFIKPTLFGEALHEEIISHYIHGKIGNFCEETCKK